MVVALLILAAAIAAAAFAKMLGLLALNTDGSTSTMLALSAAIMLIVILKDRISKFTLPGGISAELNAVRKDLNSVLATTERVVERQGELAAPRMLSSTSPATAAAAGDQNKGQFGGRSTANGFTLSAKVTEADVKPGWFRIDLRVATREESFEHPVTFHLHETFPPEFQTQTVRAIKGQATLTVLAWGAFTVGVWIPSKDTKLELDLSEDPRFPDAFTTR